MMTERVVIKPFVSLMMAACGVFSIAGGQWSFCLIYCKHA